MACYSDFAGQVRGKGFPARELEERWEKGVGWTPTNIMINCFGVIPATPWGASGDLLLRPDPAGDATLDFGDGTVAERFILGYVDELDGAPWACCPRHYLAEALADLEREFGLRLRVAFEHEFTCLGFAPRLGAAYGLESIRQIGDLPEVILAALDRAGLEPDTFLPEYAPGQYEVTVRPALGLEAADRAVKLRQIVRAATARKGWPTMACSSLSAARRISGPSGMALASLAGRAAERGRGRCPVNGAGSRAGSESLHTWPPYAPRHLRRGNRS